MRDFQVTCFFTCFSFSEPASLRTTVIPKRKLCAELVLSLLFSVLCPSILPTLPPGHHPYGVDTLAPRCLYTRPTCARTLGQDKYRPGCAKATTLLLRKQQGSSCSKLQGLGLLRELSRAYTVIEVLQHEQRQRRRGPPSMHNPF